MTGLGERGRILTIRHPWIAGLVGTLISRALMIGIGLVSTVILARSLGPTGRGVYAVAVSASLVAVAIGTLGYHTANPYFVAAEPDQLGALVSNSLTLSAAAAGVAGIAALVVDALDHALLPVTGALLLLVIVWVPVGILFAQLQPVMLALDRVRTFNIVEAGWQITATALVAVLWVGDWITPTTAFGVTLASLAGASAWLVFQLARHGQSLKPSWALLARTFPYAGRSYLASVVGLLLVRLDILVVKGVLGSRQAGFYAIAAAVGEIMILPPATIGVLLFPKLNALESRAERLSVARRVASFTGVAMLGLCALCWLVAPLAVRVLYGSQYLPSVTAIRWTLPGLVLFGANIVLSYYFLSGRMPLLVILGQAVAVVINIGVDLAILRDMGISGAGLASSLAYGFMLVVSVLYLWLHPSVEEPETAAHQSAADTPAPSREP